MRGRFIIPYVLPAAFLFLVAAGWPQYPFPQAARDQTNVMVDHDAFASDQEGKIRLEVHYQIFNDALEFRQDGDVYEADYEVAISVIKDKRSVASHQEDKKARASSLTRSLSRRDYRIGQANFDLEPGKYEVNFAVSDNLGEGVIRRDFKVKLQDFDRRKAHLSDIQMVQATAPADSVESPFTKGNVRLVPSLSRQYGGESGGRLLYYFEIYAGSDSTAQVTVETALRHGRRGLVYRDTLTTEIDGPVTRQLREVSLDSLGPGEYELEVRLRGRRWKKLDESKENFYLPWSLANLIQNEFDEAVDQLELIGNSDEIDAMKDLEDMKRRREAFDEFWASRDPDPSTPENEVKQEFYRRIGVANRLFPFMGRSGWRSDRGRIYVSNGEPDQIDDYPFSPDRRPYQIWHYYQRGPYRRYTFVDDKEDGDYRLIYPYDGLYSRPDF